MLRSWRRPFPDSPPDTFLPLRSLLWIVLLCTVTVSPAGAQEETLLSKGIDAFEEERYDDAITHLEEHVSEESDPEAYTYLGHAYYYKQSYEKARSMYEQARKQGLSKDQATLYLARVTIAEGRPLDALESIRPQLGNDDSGSFAVRLFGRALEKAGQFDLASHVFRRILVEDKFEDAILQKLYSLSMKQEQFNRARQYVDLLQQRNSLNTDYLLLDAEASLKQGHVRTAGTTLELARRLGRIDADLYRTIADIRSKNKQYLSAVHYYRLLLNRIDSPGARDLYRLGVSLLETGQYGDAENRLFEAARKDSSYFTGVLRLIRTLHGKRPFKRVEKLLSKAREEFPNRKKLHRLAGNIFMEEEFPQNAFDAFSKLNPDDITDRGTLYNFAYSAVQTDRRERAFELLTTSIARYPDHEPFRSLLNRLLENG